MFNSYLHINTLLEISHSVINFGQGESMDQALSEMNIVCEGIYTTKSVYHLAKEKNVDMPITNALSIEYSTNVS
ncbi:NAD(P)H-dependent glycerol-3-phosphate dehydrogenase [Staphylococcus aureus]